MQEYRRGALNALYLILVQGVNYIVPLAVMFHLMKELGVSGFGEYAFWYSVMLYVQTFVDYGFSFSGTRDLAAAEGGASEIAVIFYEVTLAKLLLSVGVLIFFAVFCFLNDHDYQLVLIVAVTGVVTALIPNWYFQGIQQLKVISLLNVIGKVVFFVLVYSVIDGGSKVKDMFLLHLLGGGLPLFFGYWISCRSLPWAPKWDFHTICAQYFSGWHIFSTTMLSMLLSNGGVFWLGVSASPAVVGVYAAVEKVVKAIAGLFVPISQAFYPLNSRMFSLSFDRGMRSVFVTGSVMVALCAVAVLVFNFSSALWFEVFKIPVEGNLYLGLLLSWVFFSVFNNVAGIQTLSASGAAARYAYSFNVAAVAFILVVYLGEGEDAGVSVAKALLLSEVVLSVLLVLNVLHITAKNRLSKI